MIIRIHREWDAVRIELGRLWLIRSEPKHPNGWMLVWRRGLPEWDPRTKWQGSDKPGPYWKGCAVRLESIRLNQPIQQLEARCRFPNCDELCLRHLPERERDELKRLDAERKAESKRYRDEWIRKLDDQERAR